MPEHAVLTLLACTPQAECAALLRTGLASPHPKAMRLCANLLKVRSALWTFVTHPGGEPTNNAAERALR